MLDDLFLKLSHIKLILAMIKLSVLISYKRKLIMKKKTTGRTDLDNTLNEITSHPERGLGLLGVKGIIGLLILVVLGFIVYILVQ